MHMYKTIITLIVVLLLPAVSYADGWVDMGKITRININRLEQDVILIDAEKAILIGTDKVGGEACDPPTNGYIIGEPASPLFMRNAYAMVLAALHMGTPMEGWMVGCGTEPSKPKWGNRIALGQIRHK